MRTIHKWATVLSVLALACEAAPHTDQSRGLDPAKPEPTVAYDGPVSVSIAVDGACTSQGFITAVSAFAMPDNVTQALFHHVDSNQFAASMTLPAGEHKIITARAYAAEQLVGVGGVAVDLSTSSATTVTVPLTMFEPMAPRECEKMRVKAAIDAGLEFLRAHQLSWGEFDVQTCTGRTMDRHCWTRSRTFPTTFVMYALAGISHPTARTMEASAAAFLLDEVFVDDTWPYWASRSGIDVPSDVDTTATIAFALAELGYSFSNQTILMDNRDEQGRFKTWLPDWELYEPNNVDCVVNANALLYLGDVTEACNYVAESVKSGSYCSLYYPDAVDLTYAASRALKTGRTCLSSASNAMMAISLTAIQDTRTTVLKRAFAANTLFNLSSADAALHDAMDDLLSLQSTDGGWPRDAFYCMDCSLEEPEYIGSRELTTGAVLEALANYQRLLAE